MNSVMLTDVSDTGAPKVAVNRNFFTLLYTLPMTAPTSSQDQSSLIRFHHGSFFFFLTRPHSSSSSSSVSSSSMSTSSNIDLMCRRFADRLISSSSVGTRSARFASSLSCQRLR